ncbi:hypothetical protein NDU88_007135 [Pleurodeles waltl]|uniref:Uncharacterized protein n=1 Tax=Pleurodeles waltl TaxID=8319 RepID=A0AAV7P006_PLEWA|nr:hypothetical protein NDU88_007135 [Pleurodeles waltl]
MLPDAMEFVEPSAVPPLSASTQPTLLRGSRLLSRAAGQGSWSQLQGPGRPISTQSSNLFRPFFDWRQLAGPCPWKQPDKGTLQYSHSAAAPVFPLQLDCESWASGSLNRHAAAAAEVTPEGGTFARSREMALDSPIEEAHGLFLIPITPGCIPQSPLSLPQILSLVPHCSGSRDPRQQRLLDVTNGCSTRANHPGELADEARCQRRTAELV